MAEQLPIQYREFYDVPRLFTVVFKGTRFLFDCSFDEALDEYPDEYAVYVLPSPKGEHALDGSDVRSHEELLIATVPTSDVEFDPTRRTAISSSVFDRIALPR